MNEWVGSKRFVLERRTHRAKNQFDLIFNLWRERCFGRDYAANPQAAPAADPDNDGSSNYQEFLGGTDPLDPNSVKIRAGARLAPLISWHGVPNKVYRVLRSDDVHSTNVVVVAPSVVATNTVSTFIDPNPDLNAFYWIELAPSGSGP